MSDPTSRYKDAKRQVLKTTQGDIPYLAIRMIPRPDTLRIASQAKLGELERLDITATKTMGDPLLYWRICDANRVMNPKEVENSGAVLNIPMPGL